MKPKFWSSPLALFITCTACHATVTLQFAQPGKYTVALCEGSTVRATMAAEAVKSLPLTGADKSFSGKGKRTIQVLDTATGNEATLPLPADGTVTVKPGSFKAISRVTIRVSDAKGGVPETAAVTLRDGAGAEQSATLTPQDAGTASFLHVVAGQGTVTVQQGAPDNRQTVSMRLPLTRAQPQLELPAVVTLPDGMKTVASPQTASAAQPEPKRPQAVRSGGILTGFIGFIIALLAFLLAGFWVAGSLRSRGVTVQSALSAAGVQLPDDPEPIPVVAAEPPKPVDPTICPFCGARKEPNAPCTNCAVAPGAPLAPQPAASRAGSPRLVCIAGPKAVMTIDLTGTMTVGRDPSRDVSIPDDASLSRHHANIETAGSSVTLIDNGSSNGTWVNGRKIDRQLLRSGDEILVGSSRFRFEA